jgi:hypothetical protein
VETQSRVAIPPERIQELFKTTAEVDDKEQLFFRATPQAWKLFDPGNCRWRWDGLQLVS